MRMQMAQPNMSRSVIIPISEDALDQPNIADAIRSIAQDALGNGPLTCKFLDDITINGIRLKDKGMAALQVRQR